MANFSQIGVGSVDGYSTPAEWWAGVSLADAEIGRMMAQEFTAAFNFDGRTTTSTLYGELQAEPGAEHDGRHHAQSGLGNARFNHSGAVATVRLRDDFVRLAWMEVQGPGNNNFACVQIVDVAAGSQIYVHHNILHNDWASTAADNSGIITFDADCQWFVYRNIFFGFGGTGVRTDQAAANSVIFYNTVYGNNRNFTGADNSRGGIAVGSAADTNVAMRYNAAFRNRNVDIRLTRGIQNYNYSSDASAANEGAQSVGNVDTTLQFVSPIDVSGSSATWASLNLLLISGASLIGAGVVESNATYPEIDYPVNDRYNALGASWDIGAAQFGAGGGGGGDVSLAGALRQQRLRRLIHF